MTAPRAAVTASASRPAGGCTDDDCTTGLIASATQRRDRALANGQTAHARVLERQITQLKEGLGS